MSRVFVFTATKMESRIVERMMRATTHPPGTRGTTLGRIGDNQILLVKTGMGPRNARAAAAGLLQPSGSCANDLRDMPVPDAVIVTGLAGSLSPVIGEGDIIVYQKCLGATEGANSISCSAELVESATRLFQEHGLKSKTATGISSPRIAQLDRDRELLAESGAAVVDMESFEIAACSVAAGVPVAVIRAVSDSPGSSMPNLNRALDSAGGFNRWVLASVLVARPLATAKLFKSSRRAIAALERALGAILSKQFVGVGPGGMPAGHMGALSQIQR